MSALADELRAAVRAELAAAMPDVMARLRAEVRSAMTEAVADELLDVPAAAKLAGVTVVALRRRLERGKSPWPVVRCGRSIRFRRSAILGGAQ